MDTSAPLPTSSSVLHCTNTIECTLNGYQVFPHSAALILFKLSLAEMSVQCLVTACVYLPRCLPYLKRETPLSGLHGKYEFTTSSWIAQSKDFKQLQELYKLKSERMNICSFYGGYPQSYFLALSSCQTVLCTD